MSDHCHFLVGFLHSGLFDIGRCRHFLIHGVVIDGDDNDDDCVNNDERVCCIRNQEVLFKTVRSTKGTYSQ